MLSSNPTDEEIRAALCGWHVGYIDGKTLVARSFKTNSATCWTVKNEQIPVDYPPHADGGSGDGLSRQESEPRPPNGEVRG